jgi:Laminin G domain
MLGRQALAVTVMTATMVVTTATTADAVDVAMAPVAMWRMNEGSGARVMFDSSGHGLNGSIGREVQTGMTGSGAVGYRFERLQPDTPPPHPAHIITVPDNSMLDPGNRDYAVTIRLRTRYQFGNIVQKGQATVAGGNWKFQIPNGIVQCLFRGSAGSIIVSAHHRINDGNWHTVRCDRTANRVAMTVDGTGEAYRNGTTGTISNTWPVSIGGKVNCDQVKVGCDYYAGDLDQVEIDAR